MVGAAGRSTGFPASHFGLVRAGASSPIESVRGAVAGTEGVPGSVEVGAWVGWAKVRHVHAAQRKAESVRANRVCDEMPK